MNKKDLLAVLEDCIVFTINTPYYKSLELNMSRIRFVNDHILELTVAHKEFIYIDIRDISTVRVIK